MLALMVVAGIAGAVAAHRGRWEYGLGAATGVFLLAGLFMVQAVGPVSNAYRSRAGFARTVAARVPPDAPLFVFRQSSFVLPFYARRSIPNLDGEATALEALSRHRAIHVILDPRQVEYLGGRGFRVDVIHEASWVPPGRSRDRRTLVLARITSGDSGNLHRLPG
jgi:hypothetical protein